MNAVGAIASALLSTEPLHKQRPFWPGMILPIGSLMMTLFGKSSGRVVPLISQLGAGVAAVGFLLILRYFIVSHRSQRIRTKAV